MINNQITIPLEVQRSIFHPFFKEVKISFVFKSSHSVFFKDRKVKEEGI